MVVEGIALGIAVGPLLGVLVGDGFGDCGSFPILFEPSSFSTK
jgi:hypothetical protein